MQRGIRGRFKQKLWLAAFSLEYFSAYILRLENLPVNLNSELNLYIATHLSHSIELAFGSLKITGKAEQLKEEDSVAQIEWTGLNICSQLADGFLQVAAVE